MRKYMIVLIILWLVPISPVVSEEMPQAVPLSDSVVFFKVPFVATCGDRVLFFDSSENSGSQLTVFSLSNGKKETSFSIRNGQGPCEGLDLFPLGCQNSEWLVVKSGNKQLFRFDQNGHCKGVEDFPLIGKHLLNVFFADMCGGEMVSIHSIFTKRKLGYVFVYTDADGSQKLLLKVANPSSVMPPRPLLTRHFAVLVDQTGNSRTRFQLRVFRISDGKEHELHLKFVLPETKFEIAQSKEELRQAGFNPKNFSNFSIKKLNRFIFKDSDRDQIYLNETVEKSKLDHRRFVHMVDLSSGTDTIREIPFNFNPLAAVPGRGWVGVIETKEGDYIPGVLPQPVETKKP